MIFSPQSGSRSTTAIFGTLAFLLIAVALLLTSGSVALAGSQTLKHDTVADFNPGTFSHTGLTQDTRPSNAGDGNGEIRLLNVGINPATWKSDGNTSGLPSTGLWGHAATYLSGRIYFSGGNNGTNSHGTSGVFFTSINANHNLTNWTATTSLPASRYEHMMTQLGGYAYVIGGISSTLDATKTVYKATFNNDGSLGSWTTTNPLPISSGDVGIYDSGIATVNGRIYVLGGHNNTGASLSSVFIGTQGLNGDLTWANATASLPVPLGEHAVTVYQGTIYVLGGINNNQNPAVYSPEVYLGTPNQSGDITSFVQSSAVMPNNLVHASGAVYSDQLYAPGGAINTGGSPRSSILSDLLNENGSLIVGGWTTSDVLSSPRIQTTAIMTDDGWLYVMEGGTGSNGLTPLTTIDYGPTATTGGVFAPDGVYTSQPFDIGSKRPLLQLRWNTSVFANTTIGMQYRSADTLGALAGAAWTPGAPLTSASGVLHTNSTSLSGSARYFQYRASFATTEITSTPIMNWVELDYDALPTPTPTFTNTAVGTGTSTPTPTFTTTATATKTPSPTPTRTTTLIATATATRTATATTATNTRTPTVSPTVCVSKPSIAELVSPENRSKIKVRKVPLEWKTATCANKYKILVKKDTKKSKAFYKKTVIGATQVTTKRLPKGHVYFWRVKACNAAGCSKWSDWWKFKIPQ